MRRSYREGDEPIPGAGYRLVCFLGRGGFGEVWKAAAPGGAEAAVKIIRLDGREGLKEFRALQLVKRVRHTHLMPLVGFWLKDADGEVLDDSSVTRAKLTSLETSPDTLRKTMTVPAALSAPAELIIVMGLGDKSLSDRLQECRARGLEGIPVEELLGYMGDAAEAIDFLNDPEHDQASGPAGIQHCDIKPHNLMIVGGAVQVCDFGLARMMGVDRVTTAAASIAYAAPELLDSNSVSASTDQYSLAITYYELKTGKLPYPGETITAVLDAKHRDSYDFSACRVAEQTVLRRAAARDPKRRFPSSIEFVKALRSATEPPVPPKRRGLPVRTGVLLATLLCAGAFAVWWYSRPGHVPPVPPPPVAVSTSSISTTPPSAAPEKKEAPKPPPNGEPKKAEAPQPLPFSVPKKPPPPPPPPWIKPIREALASPQKLLQVVESHFPTEKPDSWPQVYGDDLKLVTQEVPAGLGRLAAGPAYVTQTNDLGRAKAWLQAATTKFPGYPEEISVASHALLERRIALRVWEPQRPEPGDWKLIREWEELHKGRSGAKPGGSDDVLARAWRVECVLALGEKPDSVEATGDWARKELSPIREQLNKLHRFYGRYLWCRALRAALKDAAAEAIVAELELLLPDLQGPDESPKTQGRGDFASRMVAEAAQNRREQARPWSRLDQVPFNPFADKAEAQRYARLLKAVVGPGKVVSDAGARMSLALAAFHQPKPDLPLVWPLARELLPVQDVSLKPDLLPLLYAGAASFWRQPKSSEPPADAAEFLAAVQATTQLFQELSKDEAGRIPNDKAAELSKSILEPLMRNLESQARVAAKKLGGSERISEASGAVAMFLKSQNDAGWRFPKSVFDVIESQATVAIDLAPTNKRDPAKLAEYHVMRGEARAFKPDSHAADVLADADAALRYQPALHSAWGLRGYAFFMLATEQANPDQSLKDLTESIDSGEKAIKALEKSPKKDNGTLARYKLNLSNARLLAGCYEKDTESRRKHLNVARSLALEAVEMEKHFGDEAWLLLGKIYENLASQASENPKDDYRKAVECFSQIVLRNPVSAQALCGRARCRYKALVITRLDPADFVFKSLDAALEKCREDLDSATKHSLHDSFQVESHYYLGLVYMAWAETASQQDLWEQADKNLDKARDLAKRFPSASRARYVLDWIMLPLNHATHLLTKSPLDQFRILGLLDKTDQRTKELEGIPGVASRDRVKQIAKQKTWILGSVLQQEKKYDQALEEYNKVLPKDRSQADLSDSRLLIGRATCILGKLSAEGGAGAANSALATGALDDASQTLKFVSNPKEALAEAHYVRYQARVYLVAGGGRDEARQHLDELIDDLRAAARLVKQDKNAIKYRREAARWMDVKATNLNETDPQRKPLWNEAITWLNEALDLEGDPNEKIRISQEIERLKKMLAGP